jgi:hypothetical protein
MKAAFWIAPRNIMVFERVAPAAGTACGFALFRHSAGDAKIDGRIALTDQYLEELGLRGLP